MTKKNIWLIVCGCVVAAALVGLTIFLIVTRNVKPNNPDTAPQSVDGSYRVVCYTPDVKNDASTVYTPDQTIEMKDGNFTYYMNGGTVTAKYTFTSGNKDYSQTMSAPFYRCILSMTEISNPALPASLVVKCYTSNVIELVDEVGLKEWRPVKLDGTRTEYAKATADGVQKKWNVALKGHELSEMKIDITATEFAIDNKGTPTKLSYNFNESEQYMDITGLGRAYVVKPSDTALVLVVVEGTAENPGAVTVWELKLA